MNNDAKRLVIAVRGYTTTGDTLLFGRRGSELGDAFADALEPLLQESLTTEVWVPTLDMGMFSTSTADEVAHALLDQTEQKIQSMPNLESIVIVGYSSGAVLGRWLFCSAHGAESDGSLGANARPWADKIDRMVALAGITRGWEYSSASPWHVRFAAPLLSFVAHSVGCVKKLFGRTRSIKPFIFQLRRGAPFVVAARINYLSVIEYLRSREGVGPTSTLRQDGIASTVFVLGAQDEFISPADSTELGPRAEFKFVEVERSNHLDIISIDGEDNGAPARRERLAEVIEMPMAALSEQEWVIPSDDINDYLDPMDIAEPSEDDEANRQVQHAILIVHGIRDHGFWTKRVAREIKTLAKRSGKIIRGPSPSYGYFSMWDFIRPGGRKEATYWFLEQYSNVKTHFPNAKISFVGHSNGTYVAAHALEICEVIKFERMVFAGSVVRTGFDWSRFSGRVKRVVNYVGSADAIVAFLPAVFEFLRLKWLDVGGAGAFGFKQADLVEKPSVKNVQFIRGGHGVAVSENVWPEIARFIVNGTLPTRKPNQRGRAMRILFAIAPVITPILVALAVVIIFLPILYLFDALGDNGVSRQDVVVVIAITLVLTALSWIVRRFLKSG